jgi:hypothetical protein
MTRTGAATTHTPGPWRALGNDDRHELSPAPIRTLDDVAIAEAFQTSETPDGYAEMDANARLIAAAPDLLAAVVAASHALKSYAYGNSATDLAESIAKSCDEAIAKAEGR